VRAPPVRGAVFLDPHNTNNSININPIYKIIQTLCSYRTSVAVFRLFQLVLPQAIPTKIGRLGVRVNLPRHFRRIQADCNISPDETILARVFAVTLESSTKAQVRFSRVNVVPAWVDAC
jgi:hypothetical protein